MLHSQAAVVPFRRHILASSAGTEGGALAEVFAAASALGRHLPAESRRDRLQHGDLRRSQRATESNRQVRVHVCV